MESDNIRQEEEALARLAEMFANCLDDLCRIVPVLRSDQYRRRCRRDPLDGRGSRTATFRQCDRQALCRWPLSLRRYFEAFAFGPEELADRIAQGMLRVEPEQARPVCAFLHYETMLP